MALLDETQTNPNVDDENAQGALVKTNVQKPKKKFCNTVFAAKMRDRKREEKLKKVDTEEVVTSCKSVSVDVTRITTDAVPKPISTVRHKNRRKKKFPWKHGIVKKKKRSNKNKELLKYGIKQDIKTNHISEKNNFSENSIEKTDGKMIVEENELAGEIDNNIQSKNSSTSVASNLFSNKNNEKLENLGTNIESVPDESCSCKRTEPFFGKLNTKEARILHIEKILKADSESIGNDNQKSLENGEKNISVVNQSATKTPKNNKNKMNNKNKNKDKKNVVDSTNSEKKLTAKKSKNLSENVIEAKDIKTEETNCSRTIPFVGKTLRHPLSRSIVVNCPNNVDEESNNFEKQTSSININQNLISSTNEIVKSNASLENTNKNLNTLIEDKNTHLVSTSEDVNGKIPSSNIENSKLNSVNETKLSSPIKASTDVLSKSNSLLKNTNCDQKTNLSHSKNDANKKLNFSSDKIEDLKISTSNIEERTEKISNDKEIDGCSRTKPYLGKDFPNCSRTLPFKPPFNKVEDLDQLNNTDRRNSIEGNSFCTEADKFIEGLKQNKNENIPRNQENDVNVLSNTTANIDIESSTQSNTEMQNEKWKFKRKRENVNTEEESKVKDDQCSKRMKIKLSPSKFSVKKSDTVPPSPRSTICSLFSLNCTKHIHPHEHLVSEKGIASLTLGQTAYVLLTKLEDMKDPLVLEYFKKTDPALNIEKESSLEDTNEINNHQKNKSLDNEESEVLSSKEKHKDIHANPKVTEMDTNTDKNEEIPIQNKISEQTEVDSSNDSLTESLAKSRRKLCRTSVNSSINRLIKKRRRINCIESDSDSESSSISTRLRTRQQAEGFSLRNRSNRTSYSSHDRDDDDDMEVAELSRIGSLRRRTRNYINDDSNDDDSDKEINKLYVTRSRSRAAGTFNDKSMVQERTRPKSVFNQKIEEKPKFRTRAKTPSLALSQQDTKRCLSVDNELDKCDLSNNVEEIPEKEKDAESNVQITPQNQDIDMEVPKTPSGEQQQTEFNNNTVIDDQPSSTRLDTPKSISVRKSDVSKVIDESMETPKKVPNASIEKDGSIGEKLDISTKSLKCPASNLLMQLTRSRSNSVSSVSAPTNKYVPLRDLKVQLIKLEVICSRFQDYSASEIEVLTNKYIDLLMNSNFTCDTWRNPINYHRSADTHMEQVDNSDCVSDVEMPDDSPNDSEYAKESDNASNAESETEKNTNEWSKPKTPQKSNRPLSTLIETEDSAFANQTVTMEPRNDGSVNISEVLNSQVSNEKDIEENTNETNEKENDLENQEQVESDQTKKPKTVLVNGTEMYQCLLCNKLFVNEAFLSEHNQNIHKAKNEVNTSKDPKNSVVNENQNTKKQVTKLKRKIMRKSSSTKCSVCSKDFESLDVLWDHVMQHKSEELQEAFNTKICQNKSDKRQNDIEASDESSDKGQLEKNNVEKDKSKNKNRVSVELNETTNDQATLLKIPGRSETQSAPINALGIETYATIEPIQPCAVNVGNLTICSCHAHETLNQDLQIEMVLLCKTCNVIYRRHDCFEVHFRNSDECRRKRHNKVPKLFCSGCPCILHTLMDMRTHLEMHAKNNSQGTVTFICNICKVAFFGVGSIFYQHWFNHTKAPDFVASKFSFPKLSVVSVLEDSNVSFMTTKSQEGFFYIAEHVCRQCRLPFSSEPELLKHSASCQSSQSTTSPRAQLVDNSRLQIIKLICDLCKKYYVSKENFDRHCIERNHLKTPIAKFSRVPINDNEQAFVCSLCRATNKSLDDMKEHWKRVHSPIIELYTCKTCNHVPSYDVTNYTYEKFEKHCHKDHKSSVITCLVYFVTARYVCNFCKFGFETEKSLKDHQVVHQKKSTQASTDNAVSMGVNTPFDSQIPPLWGNDKNMQQPVYVNYSNGNVDSAQSQNTVQTSQNQEISVIMSPNQINTSVNSALASTPLSSNQNSNVPPTLLRNILTTNAMNQLQQQQQQHQTISASSPTIETILIDSRSNSPVSDTATPTPTNIGSVCEKSPVQGSNNSTDSGSSSVDKEKTSNVDYAAASPSSVVSPQPFEVVLVTDDISNEEISIENPTSDKSTDTGKTMESKVSASTQQHLKQQSTELNESSSSKPFLRVRTIAELQQIKIHRCAQCELNFDSAQVYEEHKRLHEKTTMPIIGVDLGRETPVQMISPMVMQNKKEATNNSIPLLAQLRQQLSQPPYIPNGQASLNDQNSRTSPSLNPSQPQTRFQPQQQQQQQPYWFASCNGTSDMSSSNYNNLTVNRQQPNILRRQPMTNNTITTSSTGYSTRPPPAYSTNPNSMLPSRSAATQLPERNATSNNIPATTRPSGTATRIPQQSLPHFETLLENRQSSPQSLYNVVDDSTTSNSSLHSRMQPNSLSRAQQIQFQGKTYSRIQSNMNYTDGRNNTMNYNTQMPQQQMQRPLYPCKYQNCTFRTDSLGGLRTHERVHTLNTPSVNYLQQQPRQPQPIQPLQQPISQQRLPVKHVSVSQMPERPRHAIPTNRSAVGNINGLLDKRTICRICNIYLSSGVELMEHIATAHNPQTSQVCCYVCDYCKTPLLFDSEAQLREHMNISHNHLCDICKKRYPSKEDLLLHMDLHKKAAT